MTKQELLEQDSNLLIQACYALSKRLRNKNKNNSKRIGFENVTAFREEKIQRLEQIIKILE